MRIVSASVGYVLTVLAVIAIASLAVFQLYGASAKQGRDLDAEIDRIVAQYHEKKRLVALTERETPPQVPPMAAVTTASAATDDDVEARDQAAQKQIITAQSTKKLGRRANRRTEQFLPAAFASLPKFAASTAASTLFRLK